MLVFNDNKVTVYPSSGPSQVLDLPANGVIPVRNGPGCGAPVSQAVQDYSDSLSCANVYVTGRYADSVTLVSDKDISSPTMSTRASDDDLLGLIATDFVRVYPPVTDRVLDPDGINNTRTNASGTLTNVRILALKHSFVVDNYHCGARLGTLTVNGAIAQTYRGPVGTSGGRQGPRVI